MPATADWCTRKGPGRADPARIRPRSIRCPRAADLGRPPACPGVARPSGVDSGGSPISPRRSPGDISGYSPFTPGPQLQGEHRGVPSAVRARRRAQAGRESGADRSGSHRPRSTPVVRALANRHSPESNEPSKPTSRDPHPLSPQPLHPPPCSFPWSGVTNGPCLPGQGSARKPGDLCDARKLRPTTVKDGSDDCCCSQLVTVAQADHRLWREDGGRISRSGGRGGTTERRRIRCPGCHEAREAGCGARRGRPSRTRPGQRRRTRASGPRAGWFRREQPA